MAGMSGVNGAVTGPQASQNLAQFQVLALKKQLDVSKQIGDAAVQLIQSASIDPAIGKNLNLRA